MKLLNRAFGVTLFLAVGLFTLPAFAASFDLLGPGGSDVDTDSTSPTTFNIIATGEGTITDLNFAIHLWNDRGGPDNGLYFPDTMAWGDLDVTLSHDGVEVQLWEPGDPGETKDLFVVLDDTSTTGQTLNDLLLAAPDQPTVCCGDQPGPVPTMAPNAFTSGGPYSAVDPNSVAASYDALGDLSDFIGHDLAGIWTLTIFDTVVPNEGDDLIGWQIFGSTDAPAAAIPLPAAFPLFGTGLGLLGFLGWRRRRQAQAV